MRVCPRIARSKGACGLPLVGFSTPRSPGGEGEYVPVSDRLGGPAAILIAAICAAQCQQNQYHFTVSASASPFPIVRGATDMPDGTWLFINLQKPWLPDAQQRIAQGRPACGSDCIPAETGANHLLGATVVVQNGGFAAGPFSFKGQPISPGIYPIEIKLSFDLKTATPEQIRSSGAILYQSDIEVAPPSGSASRPDPTGRDVSSAPCEAIADKQNRTACFHNAGIPVVDCQHPQSADDLHFCHGPGDPRPFASAAMPSQTAPRQNWRVVKADNGAAFDIDLNSITPSGDGVEAVIYMAQGQPLDLSNLKRMLFDCHGHMTDVTDTQGAGNTPAVYLPPQSIGAKLANVACTNR